jgi:purine-binding chemotaxis protein CheW
MSERAQLIVFTLDARHYALRLSAVERSFRMVEISPLPKAPAIVLGVINVQGRVLPVVNIRKRFHLPERDVSPDDQLIVARTSRRAVALVVDAVSGMVDRADQDIIAVGEIFPGIEYVEGVVKLEDGLVLIHDVDRFLSLEEDRALGAALTAGR